MNSKYHVHTSNADPRYAPIMPLSAFEIEGCLGCLECVKRDSCVYDVYQKREFDPDHVVDTADVLCIRCMRCVQECKKNILSRAPNAQYQQLGNSYWTPGIISNIWKQAQTGVIPVSGTGYGGPFAGPGFDAMWTDMSEIVRPTRDGIHGREYISTVVELGRRPECLEFDAQGQLTTQLPPFKELPIPLILEIPSRNFVSPATRRAIVGAAEELGTLALVDLSESADLLDEHAEHLIGGFDMTRDDPASAKKLPVVEVAYTEDVMDHVKQLKAANPEVVISIRLPLDENAAELASCLAAEGAEMIHLVGGSLGTGIGAERSRFATHLVRDVHFALVNKSSREQVTLMYSGGIALAEHVAKIIACGVDVVGVDLALLVALECRLCGDCESREECPVTLDAVPVEWGQQRVVNLMGSWHSQLIEVMGAMGLREVRRLRGELGRVMFFEDLEKESFAPYFGERVNELGEPGLAPASGE